MPQVSQAHQQMIREKILNSTYRLFVREGERMTTQMVCDDARVSKGTLFHYFGSKDQLLRDAFDAAHAHAGRLSSDGVDLDAPEKQVVLDMIRRALTWGVDFPDEVIFSERYNDAMHHSMASGDFHQRVSGIFDIPALRRRLLRRIPEPYHEYAMILASATTFHLVVYVASRPHLAQDEQFVAFASERIWRIFEG